MVKIVIDAGHGFNTPGKRSPDDEREWSFNNKVAKYAIAKLKTYKNVEILRVDDPTGKTDVPLTTRTSLANEWQADVYASIHHNTLADKWGVIVVLKHIQWTTQQRIQNQLKLRALFILGLLWLWG